MYREQLRWWSESRRVVVVNLVIKEVIDWARGPEQTTEILIFTEMNWTIT